MKHLILYILLHLSIPTALAQEDNNEPKKKHERMEHIKEAKHERLSKGIVAGVSYNPPICFETYDNHEKCNTDFFNPVVGLDFGFAISSYFEIILMADLEYVIYDILTYNSEDVPVHTSTVSQFIFDFAFSLAWMPHRKSLIYAGLGAELGHHETLGLVRVGIEYEFVRMENWSIKPTFMVDIKGKDNLKYSVGVVFSKISPFKK